ncbi:hypothetical protein C882_3876 [Caenispirillum salinarum AK4]|uniref:Uncharacterized protein n=1 Tax=Caenispirillum salinarum AK4 TaxID=1238182 RepID=K9HMD5_9PROT|nr:hypothetical protein [Caenispirillum salinarum]EKV31503.1 hypothetical protein C882_3876 [Caenispirillum salinarum AK4]
MTALPAPARPRRAGIKRLGRRFARAATACALALPLLAGCYLPDRFESEIRLTQTGEYGLYYEGDLIWLPLVRDLRMGKVTEAEIPEKMDVLEADLARDSNFSKVEPTGTARFAVEYNRLGKLNWPELVTFVRRNARIISMETDPETGTVSVRGSQAIKMIDPETIERIGLNSRGLLRVTTNAEVIEHNADSVRSGPRGYTLYDWNINGVRGQEPRLKARLRAH